MDKLIEKLEAASTTSRDIVRLRVQYLQEGGAGLALAILPMLSDRINAFLNHLLELRKSMNGDSLLSEHTSFLRLKRILELYIHLARNDPTLGEELARLPVPLVKKLVQYDISQHQSSEEQQDAIIEIQDLICEISTHAPKVPFTTEELHARLPLEFDVSAAGPVDEKEQSEQQQRIMIHQVTTRQSAQKDVGFGKSYHSSLAMALSVWMYVY